MIKNIDDICKQSNEFIETMLLNLDSYKTGMLNTLKICSDFIENQKEEMTKIIDDQKAVFEEELKKRKAKA